MDSERMNFGRLLRMANHKTELEMAKREGFRQYTAEIIAAIHNFAGFGTRNPISADVVLGKSGKSGGNIISPDESGAIVDEFLAKGGKPDNA